MPMENHVYLSVGHQQMMTDPLKPLGMSLMELISFGHRFKAGGRLFVCSRKRLGHRSWWTDDPWSSYCTGCFFQLWEGPASLDIRNCRLLVLQLGETGTIFILSYHLTVLWIIDGMGSDYYRTNYDTFSVDYGCFSCKAARVITPTS